MAAARRAGIQEASIATATSTPMAPAVVQGSVTSTPTSEDLSNRATASAAGMPTITPAGDQPQRVAQHHARDVARGGAHRHPDANLVGAPGHRVDQQAAESDRGQDQGDPTEGPGGKTEESLGAQHAVEESGLRVELRHGHVGVGARGGLMDRRRQL